MINLLVKFEKLMDALLYWVGAKFLFLWSKIFPKKISSFLTKKTETFLFFITRFFSHVRTKILHCFSKLKVKNWTSDKKPVKKINKGDWKKTIKTSFHSFYQSLFAKFSHIDSTRLAIAVTLSSFIIMGLIGVFYNSQKIYLSMQTDYFQMRTPASVVTSFQEKKEYHNLAKKMVKIGNIKVPTLVEHTNDINNITIDFNIVSDNRFISLFIENHTEEVKDYIIMGFKPILSSFVIKEEGKEVIKSRIHTLLDNYLMAKGIEGSIDDVQIEYIIGS